MKRLHVHVSVENLEQSIAFYSALFGTQPSKQKPAYAKWMLDDPRINFAISERDVAPGLDHLGIQAEDEVEMQQLRDQIKAADLQTFDEGETTCCYARSDKTWVKDPSGIAWETYHTMEDVEYFNESSKKTSDCCVPKTQAETHSPSAQESCC